MHARLAGFTALALALTATPSVRAQEPGLGGRSDVVLQDGFEVADWYAAWGRADPPNNTQVVSDGSALSGSSHLRVQVPAGGHYGTSFGFDFADQGMAEPDEVYFRYAIRLGPSWTTEGGGGGKLPGFGGTYGVAGWGGRPVNGSDGWSARGLFWQPDSGRAGGATRIGYYVYHADMTGTYGDNWYWSGGPLGTNDALERGRWYQLEMHVVMNTPGSNDGVLEGWVDGQKVFERNDVRFRDVDTLHVERVWFDMYYGGSWTAPTDMYLDFDNVVIAWGYIGPYSDPGQGNGGSGGTGTAGGAGTGGTGTGNGGSSATGGTTGTGGAATAGAGPTGPGANPASGSGDDGGCGCRTVTTGGGATSWLVTLLLLPIALRRRAARFP